MAKRPVVLLEILLLAGLLTVFGAGFMLIPRMLFPPLSSADLIGVADPVTRIQLRQAQDQLQNNARSALLQGFAGLLVVLGALATWRQVNVSREGQLTDRFTRAIDQLGNDKPEVRVGGIRALERLAANSKQDRAAIAYVLGAFVRVRAAWTVGSRDVPAQATPAVDEDLPWLQQRAPDVQTAMWVLGRRLPAGESVSLYLPRIDLRGAHLAEANLSDVELRQANLARAWMPGITLNRSNLAMADLRQANLIRAQLRGANLEGANLRGAQLDGTDLTNARADARTVWPPEYDADRLRREGVVDVASAPDPHGRAVP